MSNNGTDLSTSRITPVIDFTSQDFDSINADLTDYAQANFSDRWTDFNEDQFAIVFKEMISYVGDLTSYMINSVIREAFAATVIRRQNLQNIGKTFDYQLLGAVPSTVSLALTLDPVGAYPTTILRTDQYATSSGINQVIYHPTSDTIVSSYPIGGVLNIGGTQGEFFINVLIGVSNGLPNQRWQLPQQGVYSPSITVVVGAQTWNPTKNFTIDQSTDLVYKVNQTDDNNTFIIFGDGVFGSIPANAASIYATFNVGGGRLGNNKPINSITTKVSANPVILSVTNTSMPTGGDDPQSMKSGRNGIPASLSTLQRGVTTDDYANLALQIPGVAKAQSGPGVPVGARIIRVWVAPNGGGAPTPQLLSLVSNSLTNTKMVTNRIQPLPPFYKNLLFNVLLHINPGFRASDVLQTVRQGIINSNQTGLLDFPQLDFAGEGMDANGNVELLITQTLLQGYFNTLAPAGLDRAEIQQLQIDSVARIPVTGNTGNGVVSGVTTTSRQRRRQYYIQLISSAQYAVYERITGFVTSLTDTILIDANEIYDNEGVANFNGYSLISNSNSPSVVSVLSAIGSNITINSPTSLFTITAVGDQYYLYNPVPTIWNVGGSPFVSSDGNVSFTVTSGANPFVGNDYFTLDVYPIVSDIVMAVDEYPQLLDGNFITRTSGGSPV